MAPPGGKAPTPNPGPGNKRSSKGGATRKGKRRGDDDEHGYSSGKNQQLSRPPDQEKLTADQLKEEIIRSLNVSDPIKEKNLSVWDFNERGFVPLVFEDQMVTLFYLPSELIFKDTEEIREFKGELIDFVSDPEEEEVVEESNEPKSKVPPIPKLADKEKEKAAEVKEEPAEDPEEKEKEEEGAAPPPAADSKPKKLLNQFNFCERASQTYNQPMREHSCQTQPPPRANYKDYCNQWIIYDAYEADKHNRPQESKHGAPGEDPSAQPEEAHGDQDDADKKKTAPAGTAAAATARKDKEKEGTIAQREQVKMRKQSVLEGTAAQDAALTKSCEGLRILERLVMQNIHNEVLYDFKYYEDPADEYRDTGEGTLLPLWKFAYDRAKKLHVTGISWAPNEPDLFAVSYGSFSFVHPVLDGMVVIFSIRNCGYPEYVWLAPKGAMAVDVHPDKNSLLCTALYDGNVAILSVAKDQDTSSLVMRNVPTDTKHRAPAWSVKWGIDDIDGNPNFYSAGMDGRIIHWALEVPDAHGTGGLVGTEIAVLHLPNPPVAGPDGTTYRLFGCARVLAFHPKERTTFLVGTAEGNIFRCSSLYGSKFLQIYNAHFLPVAALQWNIYHSEVFISCSEDWTIKIWDRRDLEPMYVFEIGIPILDACWAPYSSTVFAAVTDEGKVLVYDLNVNKEKPVCCQQVVTKKKVRPHRIQFNPLYPIIIVGDDRGQLTSLKLSPNLRVLPKDTRSILLEGDTRINFEINKMSKLLTLVRDPESITNPNVIPGPAKDAKQVKTILAAMTTN